MPGLDGFQLLSLAQRQQPGLASVIMTGFGTVETAIRSLREGANALVLKPFVGSELVEAVRRALMESENKRDAIRLHTLRPLFKITEILFSETDTQRLEQVIVGAIFDYLDSAHVGLYEFESKTSIKQIAWHGEQMAFYLDLLAQESIIQDLNEGSSHWINIAGPGKVDKKEFLRKYQLSSLLFAPVVSKERNGFLAVARITAQPPFR
jgi:YesN/AraC family two-component response regulator